MIRASAVFLALIFGAPALALDFALPSNARQTVTRDTGPDIYDAPVGVFANDAVPVIKIEGDVRRSAWRISSPGLTPFQVMRPMRVQLVAAGYEIALDCRAETCGGFDFRFATETLPGPNMYVNIRSYQFVTALRSDGGDVRDVVTVLASTSATSAYVQIIHAGDTAEAGISVETTSVVPLGDVTEAQEIGESLLSRGAAILADLDFESGSRDLGEGPFETLSRLAAFLEAQPDVRVALVGHTDNVGGLQANIAISRARAASVRARLIDRYGVTADRLDAEGMGYLAPVASNRAVSGRNQNRRVEVILLTN